MNANQIFTPEAGEGRKTSSPTGRRRARSLKVSEGAFASLSARSLVLLMAAGMTLVSTSFATPVVAQAGAPAAGNTWTTSAGTVQGTRFSSLAQINTTNVTGLRQEFEFETGVEAGHEGAPLVVGNTMYMVGPFPNKLFALDVANQGRLKWVFDPKANAFAEGKACCDIVNRGAVFATHPAHPNGLIIYAVLDTTVVAVDAVTGREVWRNKVGNVEIGETMTIAPLVVGDKVIVGNSGGEFGVRGFTVGLNVSNGSLAWKAFNTGPDADVLIKGAFRPFYPKDQGTNLGVTSWPTDQWKIGGGTTWMGLTYDPQLDLLFFGTSNPGPWNHEARPGDNKWTATVFARRPSTGEAIWAYQITPHDAHDFDGTNENIIVDLPIGGVIRRVLVRFDRNGFAYVHDARTGQVLSAPKYFEPTNWATEVNLTTGIPQRVEAKQPKTGIPVTNICPHLVGGKDQQPAAFSPRTNLFYVPGNRLCMNWEGLHVMYIEGTPFIGATFEEAPVTPGIRGEFFAWDATTGRKAWRIPERFPVWSGVLATAGDVVFYGTMDRFFKAVDARTGRVLFQAELDSGVIGYPMTFMGADGRQRVAVYSGTGGSLVPHTKFGVAGDSGSSSGSGSEPGLTGELRRYANKGRVHVFVLDSPAQGR
ncbi:MAG: PQQ-dependent dehydrogenase, methanol/ethanol family [Sphingomonas bacterium]|nr:PQQ-dependent dehydrogenase, methanol/ethanol family [Sphingomonas bacterium]